MRQCSTGNRGAIRKLRHCGKIPISHELKERPVAANERSRAIGKLIPYTRSASVTGSKEVESSLCNQPLHTLTPVAGNSNCTATAILGIEFYFPPPHQPWQPTACLPTKSSSANWDIEHRGKYTVALSLTIRENTKNLTLSDPLLFKY